MRTVLYMAHPVAPTGEEVDATPAFTGWGSTGDPRRDMEEGGRSIPREERARTVLQANIQRALRWLAWLRKSFPRITFIAPWIATIESLHGDDSHELREAGLVDDCAVVERCDGIVLCGGRVSSGMARERDCGSSRHCYEHWLFQDYDLTAELGEEPPVTIGPLQLDDDNAERFPNLARLARRDLAGEVPR
jgi:hypothetical protein